MSTFLGLPWSREKLPLFEKECTACCHSDIERRVSLQPSMVRFMGPLLRAGKPVHKRELGRKISGVTYSNAHYLRCWGLIDTKDPRRKHGPWFLTDAGHAFIRGELKVPQHIIIVANHSVRFEGLLVGVNDTLKSKEYEDFRLEYLSAVRV